MTKGLCAGFFEMHQRVRGMENAMLDPFMFPVNSDRLVGKLADLKIEFWDACLMNLGMWWMLSAKVTITEPSNLN